MRTSAVITMSLPTKLLAFSDRLAKKNSMTRSELIRMGLRKIAEELHAEEIIREYEQDKRAGKLKELKGSLMDALA